MVAPALQTRDLPRQVMVVRKLDPTGPMKPGRILTWSSERQMYVLETFTGGLLVSEGFVRERWGVFFDEVPAQQLTLL